MWIITELVASGPNCASFFTAHVVVRGMVMFLQVPVDLFTWGGGFLPVTHQVGDPHLPHAPSLTGAPALGGRYTQECRWKAVLFGEGWALIPLI